jgi:hypothetical protein
MIVNLLAVYVMHKSSFHCCCCAVSHHQIESGLVLVFTETKRGADYLEHQLHLQVYILLLTCTAAYISQSLSLAVCDGTCLQDLCVSQALLPLKLPCVCHYALALITTDNTTHVLTAIISTATATIAVTGLPCCLYPR